MAFTLPPWLQIQPQDFVQAMDRGAQAGLHLANINQQAMQRAEALAQETNLAQQRMAQQAQRDAEEQALKQWETQMKMEQEAKRLEALDKYRLEQIGLRQAEEAAQKQHWLNMEKAASKEKPFAIGAGGLMMPDGSIVAPLPRPGSTSDKGFTLSPGSVRMDAEGNVIGENPKTPTPTRTRVKPGDTLRLGILNKEIENNEKLVNDISGEVDEPVKISAERRLRELMPQRDAILKQYPSATNIVATATNSIPSEPVEPLGGTTEKTVSAEQAKAFLRQANGNRDAARKLARDAGYTF